MIGREYQDRRKKLAEELGSGVVLFVANDNQARNYAGNAYPFRQDSNFLYFTGINRSDLICILDIESGNEWLSGYNPGLEDAIWSGPQSGLADLSDQAGIKGVLGKADLKCLLEKAQASGKEIHYLPSYTEKRSMMLAGLLNQSIEEIQKSASVKLIRAVVKQRSIKTAVEIAEIEKALNEVTGPMHIAAMKMAKPGKFEHEIVAEMYRLAKMKDMDFAYQVICSVRGETLHNESHRNELKKDQLLLIDAGVESLQHYASDITRTCPVGGRFSTLQREIYQLVLDAQLAAIDAIRPGTPYFEIHKLAARVIASGLKDLGLMKGDVDAAVEQGAHALFFPHGLGHMMGLDVHDMEDLGEDHVGYAGELQRSSQFGTAYLRLGRRLQTGFVLTVEPGIYFIPELIKQWRSEGKHEEFINYSRLDNYKNFGGVRIEDNIHVTDTACRILGAPIPKTAKEIEALS